MYFASRFFITPISLFCIIQPNIVANIGTRLSHATEQYLATHKIPLPIFNHAPSSYGSTHFVMGTPLLGTTVPIRHATTNNKIKVSTQALFSCDGAMRKILKHLIDQEQQAIRIAMFTITDKQISDALIEAIKRGVHIEMITDPGSMRNNSSKIPELHSNGIQIFVYNPYASNKSKAGTMHHKFFIFARNEQSKPLLWTGSFNCTRAACEQNEENVIVTDDQQIISTYENQFHQLKQRSYLLNSKLKA